MDKIQKAILRRDQLGFEHVDGFDKWNSQLVGTPYYYPPHTVDRIITGSGESLLLEVTAEHTEQTRHNPPSGEVDVSDLNVLHTVAHDYGLIPAVHPQHGWNGRDCYEAETDDDGTLYRVISYPLDPSEIDADLSVIFE